MACHGLSGSKFGFQRSFWKRSDKFSFHVFTAYSQIHQMCNNSVKSENVMFS